jgi:alanyl-tRNA synthetase
MYNNNFKSLKNEIEEDLRKWRDLPCSWIGRINIVKMVALPKAIYRFNAISIKTPNTILQRHGKSSSQIHQIHLEKQKTNKQTKNQKPTKNQKTKPNQPNKQKTKQTNKQQQQNPILNNKRMAGRITIPDLLLYYRAIVIKTAWYWYRDTHID